MRILIFLGICFAAVPSLAQPLECVFTEPFINIRLNEDFSMVTLTAMGEPEAFESPVVHKSMDGDVKSVVWGEEEDFHVLDFWLDPDGGSDGMSERVYPYSAKYLIGDSLELIGGCDFVN